MKTRRFLHYIPIIVLVGLILTTYFFNFYQHLSFSHLKTEQANLKNFVEMHPVISPFLFVLIYTISVCLIIPDSTILTLIGGFIFPLPFAVFLTTVSETFGALFFFLIIRAAFQNKKEKNYLLRIRRSFNRNAVNYLLFLRFSHLLPFWLINFISGYFSIPLRTFIWTTFVGVIPLSYLLSDAGRNLSHILATETTFNLKIFFTTEMKVILLMLSILALIPLIYKNWLKKKLGKGWKNIK